MTDHEHRALSALAHTRPGMCTYPVMLRQPTPPATVTITPDNSAGRFEPAALPQPRRSFWHRVLQALARR